MSKLSVDAAIFIPGQGPADMTSQEMTSQGMPQLPQYLTTCYPFVQGDPGLMAKPLAPSNLSEAPPLYHALPMTSLPYPPAVYPVQSIFPPPQNLGMEYQKGPQGSERGLPRPERGPRPGAPYGGRPPRLGRPRQEAPARKGRPMNNHTENHARSRLNPGGTFFLPTRDSSAQTDLAFDPAGFQPPPLLSPDSEFCLIASHSNRVTVATQTFPQYDPPITARLSYASVTRAPPPPPPQPISATESTQEAESETQPVRKRRKRTRKKKSRESEGALLDERAPSPEPIVLGAADLRFEDETEFPGLLENTQNVFNVYASQPLMPYSTVLTGRPPNAPWNAWTNHQGPPMTPQYVQPISIHPEDHMTKINQSGLRSGSGQNSNASSTRSLDRAGKENKATRKRRKRRELANEAAEKELLEISLEQQVLKQIGLKGKPKGQGQSQSQGQRKSKEPVALNIAEMISALEVQQISAAVEEEEEEKPVLNKMETKSHAPIANALDSNPSVKRGKERENPKPKKPSTLKKVILKEREDKRRMRWMDETNLGSMAQFQHVDGDEDGTGQEPVRSGELSPVSQTSPISMSPISPGGSPLSSEVNSPVQPGFVKSPAAMSIHSRRFREYCNQILDKEIDECCVALLQDLVRFQDRLYHNQPNKVKSKRRFVLGLREVTKHLKLRKIKCVVISPNLERIQSKGGLDEALNTILATCQEQNVPFVFALGRRALGRACAKLVPVSVVGVFNYDGSEENYRRLMDLTEKAREQYTKMVSELEPELDEAGPGEGGVAPRPAPTPTHAVYAHMGHSRTPSGCSGISFASSMMSEPMSELGRAEETKLQVPEKNEYFRRAHLSHSRNSSLGKVSMVESITEADESHYEADTEDVTPDSRRDVTDVRRDVTETIADDVDDVDTLEELPAAQQAAQDELSCSSRTLSVVTHVTTPLATSSHASSHASHVTTPHCAGSSGGEEAGLAVSHRLKVIDQERIESWVEKAASSIQQLRLAEDDSPESANTDT